MLQGRLPSRYRVIEEVGQGGMAVVYKAHDDTLKREVAVKVLHAHLLAETDSKTRLGREAQAVAKLHHDNIVQIFDYSGDGSSTSYIVTEFIEGETLKQFMTRRQPPAPEVAALIAMEVGSALIHAHSFGIIHRDVKPENVMVRKDGMLKLMDFGVAQIMDLERMTVTGQLLGSPAYMAPEILEGKPLDVRTDVFSVGIMLYQLSTGALPFTGRNPHEVLKRIAEGKFADPRTINRQVADGLAKIISHALARRPEDRYTTMADLLADLHGFVADAGLTSPREELGAFFQEPDGYSKTIVPRMLSALVARGKQERAARRTARALELWNRALGMDPANREVLAELRRLENRQHFKRASLVAASVIVLATGAFVTLDRASVEDPGPVAAADPGPAVMAAPSNPPPAAPRPADDSADGETYYTPQVGKPPPPTPRRPRVNRNSVERTPAEPPRAVAAVLPVVPARPRKLYLNPSPPSAEIFVNNERWGMFDVDRNQIELDWTRDHVIQFRNDCCYPETHEVGPSHEPDLERLRVKFEGLPAYLTVKTNPPTTGKVGVFEENKDDGQERDVETSGDIGEPLTITFVGDTNMRKQLTVTVAVNGRTPQNKTVWIKAGERLIETVDLN
jgi:tRNA A-37 threonylcarbamoyl transferase component Bud32